MNERIKQLVDEIWEKEYWDNPNTDKLLPAQLNRFAKLIITEAAKVAREHTLRKSGVSEDFDGTVDVQEAIKQHFRV